MTDKEKIDIRQKAENGAIEMVIEDIEWIIRLYDEAMAEKSDITKGERLAGFRNEMQFKIDEYKSYYQKKNDI